MKSLLLLLFFRLLQVAEDSFTTALALTFQSSSLYSVNNLHQERLQCHGLIHDDILPQKRSIFGLVGRPPRGCTSRRLNADRSTIYPTSTFLLMTLDDNGDNDGSSTTSVETLVELGSKEYLDGFFSSPLLEDNDVVDQRGSGLEQALKLAGGVTGILVFLVLAFLASNGLL